MRAVGHSLLEQLSISFKFGGYYTIIMFKSKFPIMANYNVGVRGIISITTLPTLAS